MKTTIITIIIALAAALTFNSTFNNNDVETAAISPKAEFVSAANLKINANEMTNQFTFSENELIKKVVVYNLIGKEVKRYSAKTSQNYTLNDLPDGLYLISFLTDNEEVIKTIRLGKKNLMRA